MTGGPKRPTRRRFPPRPRRVAIVSVLAVVVVSACSSSSGRDGASTTQRPVQVTTTRPAGPAHRHTMQFEDVSAAAGLTVSQGRRAVAPRCLLSPARLRREFPTQRFDFGGAYGKEQCVPERMSGGVAVGDYDGDGWPDLYFTRLDGPGTLQHNQHDGTFTDVTADVGLDTLTEPSNGAAWADVDNDGDSDLFVTTLGGHRNWFFRNDGGRFTEDATKRGLADDDGRVHSGFSVNTGDYDGDGYIDFHVTEWRLPEHAPNTTRSHTVLFHNRGSAAAGQFEDTTTSAGVALETPSFGVVAFASAFVDLDDDRRPDLLAVNDFLTGRLFWNDGGGRFVDGTKDAGLGTEENGMGATVADYDGDGRLDVFISSIHDKVSCPIGQCVHGTTGNRLYRNLGNRRFEDVTTTRGVRIGGWGWGAAFLDAANSGADDLVMTSGVDFPWEPTATQYERGPMFVWQNLGNGRFETVTPSAAGLDTVGSGKGLATLDFDRDGRTDIVVVRDGATPVLYRNTGADTNAWIDVVLVGTTSARDSVGAVVTVTADGKTRRFRYGTRSFFLGQSEPVVHVGLGAGAAKRVRVQVAWPNGRTLDATVATNQRVVLQQPTAVRQ